MDLDRACERLRQTVDSIDRFTPLHRRRWPGIAVDGDESLDAAVRQADDSIRIQVRFAREIAAAAGEAELAEQLVEHGEFHSHGWVAARKALVELEGLLRQREELEAILGPRGPQMGATSLHPDVWTPAARLWDGEHYRQAVATAGVALEGVLQAIAGPAVAGEGLGTLFSLTAPAGGEPRLRVRGLDPDGKTYRTIHEGAAALVRGSMQAIRNLMAHPGWLDPDPDEAFEMLAVMSYVARLVDRCEVITE